MDVKAETIQVVEAHTEEEVRQAQAIRQVVFVEEQEVPSELERDGRDGEARHVLVLCDGQPVATGRLTMEPDGVYVPARIAVLASHRGRGLGRLVIERLEALAWAAGATALLLHPHAHLEAFYARLGYRRTSGTEQVGRHAVIKMTKLRADETRNR